MASDRGQLRIDIRIRRRPYLSDIGWASSLGGREVVPADDDTPSSSSSSSQLHQVVARVDEAVDQGRRRPGAHLGGEAAVLLLLRPLPHRPGKPGEDGHLPGDLVVLALLGGVVLQPEGDGVAAAAGDDQVCHVGVGPAEELVPAEGVVVVEAEEQPVAPGRLQRELEPVLLPAVCKSGGQCCQIGWVFFFFVQLMMLGRTCGLFCCLWHETLHGKTGKEWEKKTVD